MGDGLSSLQCNIRWCNYLEPLQRWLTRRNWQPKEVLLSDTDTSLHSLSYLLFCLYMVGKALAGAGTTASDPITVEHSAECYDAGEHWLDDHR